jgi:hypothetical protein
VCAREEAACARERKRHARMAEHFILHKRLVYFRTLIVFIGGNESGSQHSQHSVCRLAGIGQARCTSRRKFAPFTSSVTLSGSHIAVHGERAIEAMSEWVGEWV